MTTIHFKYTDSYNNPSRGSLAFMPHRRHAANETEVLPKPFTIPLLNGEVTVNLQPNSSSWVWIITEYFEDISKSFFTTIPDRDGIMEHTELVHISPSSIPAPYDAVEPAWWAEMRQYKTTVSDTLLKSSEALTEAQTAIETGKDSISQTQYNASLAKAYFEQSRDHSYESKDYRDEAKTWRDEAQEQADRAATGPESAATRSENAANRSETARDRAITAEDESRVNAADARNDATAAQTAASTAITARTEATSQADRAKTEADRAQGYADDLLAGPSDHADRAEDARDEAQQYAQLSESHSVTAANHVTDASDYATQALHSKDAAEDAATQSENFKDQAEQTLTTINNIHVDLAKGPWVTVTPESGYTNQGSGYQVLRWRHNGDNTVDINGVIQGGTPQEPIFTLPPEARPPRHQRCAITADDTIGTLEVLSTGIVRVAYEATGILGINVSIPAE